MKRIQKARRKQPRTITAYAKRDAENTALRWTAYGAFLDVSSSASLPRRLIRNLLENAVKHGGKDVEARLSTDADGIRVLHVADCGQGIPEAERERIFICSAWLRSVIDSFRAAVVSDSSS